MVKVWMDSYDMDAHGLENDRFEHRTSDIGNIGLQAAHRTSDCYTAPIPIRRLASLAHPACSYCLTLDRVKHSVKHTCGAACVWSLCEIAHLMSDTRVRQTTAWARRGESGGHAWLTADNAVKIGRNSASLSPHAIVLQRTWRQSADQLSAIRVKLTSSTHC